MKRFYIYALIIIANSYAINAQPWTNESSTISQQNFYDMQTEFNDYWSVQTMQTKGNGWKQFKRWEWFWEQRLFPTGEFPNPAQLYTETAKARNNKSLNSTLSSNQWTSLGPTNSVGGYSGLGRINCVKTDPNNSNIIWAGAAAGGLWKSTNGGTNWTAMTDNLPTLGVTDIAINPSNTSVMYIATGDGDNKNTYSVGVLKSTNGGASWSTTGLSYSVNQRITISRLLINQNNPSVLYAAGAAGVFKTINSGTSWQSVLGGNYKDMAFKPNDPNTIYVAGTRIYRTTNGGSNWNQLTSGLPSSGIKRIALAVTSADANYVYAILVNNSSYFLGIYRSTDSGSNWAERADSPNILGVAANGSDTYGQGWYDLCIAASPTNKDEIYVGGINLWKSTNGGTDWSLNSYWYNTGSVATVHADQHHLHFMPGSSTLFVGNDGGVYKTTNGGVNWSWIGSGLKITQFYRLGVSSTNSNLIIAGSQDNGTKRYNGSWSDISGGDGMECIIDPNNASIMYSSMQRGILQRSTNGGSFFRRMNDVNNDGNYDDINENGAWVTPYTLHPTNSSTIFAGFVNVWKSTNSGTDFTRISNFSGTTKLKNLNVAPSNANTIYTSTSGRMNRTTDGGTNWTQTARPGTGTITFITVHPNSPLTVWATTSGYSSGQKVFYSTNGGDNWVNISGSLPNVPANCLVYELNSNDKIYVGTDIGIYYRDASMNDWTAFNNGLPNVVVSELEIQYSSNKLVAATFGRGLWQISLSGVLAAPVLSLPSNSSKNLEINNINLVWGKTVNATSYQLQVSLSSNFDSFIINQSNVTDTAYVLNSLDYYTKYYWRVKASSANAVSGWSSVFDFTTKLSAPVLQSPANLSNAVNLSGTLSWFPVNGAASYAVMLSDTNDFSNVVLQNDNVTTTTLNYSGLVNYKTYYWKVKSKNPNGESDWPQSFSFTTKISDPELTSPLDNAASKGLMGTFVWGYVDGASSYNLEVSKDQNFSDLVLKPNLISTSQAYDNFSSNTKYYWRVRANGMNETSGWSVVWNFRTKLAIPKLLSPENNSTAIKLDGELDWVVDSSVDTYEVQIASDADFNNLVLDEKDISAEGLMFTSLGNNSVYYWRVRSKSGTEISGWSDVCTFTTELSRPILSSPMDNADNVNADIDLTWLSVDGADHYSIEIAENSSMQTVIKQGSDINTTKFEIDGLSKNKTYFWRTKAFSNNNNNNSNNSEWSDVWSFSTERDITVLNSPSDNSGAEPVEGKLTWKGITTATSYKLQIDMDDKFDNPLIDIGGLSEVEYNYSGFGNYQEYFWRVGAEYADGSVEWSDLWSFTTVIAEPGLVTPVNNAVGISLSGYFQWSVVTGAAYYSVQLSVGVDFSDLVFDIDNTTGLNVQYQNLDHSKQYYWRIKAHNAFGESGWSEIRKFTTESVNSILFGSNGDGQLSLKAYPNPTPDEIEINYELYKPGYASIVLYDRLGRMLHIIKGGHSEAGNYKLSLDLGNYLDGLYYLMLRNGNNSKTVAIIKSGK